MAGVTFRGYERLVGGNTLCSDSSADVGYEITVRVILINRKGSRVTVSATVGVPSLYRIGACSGFIVHARALRGESLGGLVPRRIAEATGT